MFFGCKQQKQTLTALSKKKKKGINSEDTVVQLQALGMRGARGALGNLHIRNKGTMQRGMFISSSSFFRVERPLSDNTLAYCLPTSPLYLPQRGRRRSELSDW